MVDEIPEALRDEAETEKSSGQSRTAPSPKKRSPVLIIGGLLGLGAIALIASPFLSRITSQPDADSSVAAPPKKRESTPGAESTSTSRNTENLLGHLPYQEAPGSELKPVTSDGRIKLRTAAAERYIQMRASALADGVKIAVISGFRSVSEQQVLFFEVKEQRGQVTSKRAEVSAPPGYSEHHTGYAIDIGDGNAPATNLSPNFEKTSAFRWLEKNAARYSFELSFPRDNPQGISYEPWHWRFVGDRASLETFYKAKNLQQGTDRK